MFNYEYFFKERFPWPLIAFKPEPFPKSNLRRVCLFRSYNYNHFMNIVLQVILPRTISKYC